MRINRLGNFLAAFFGVWAIQLAFGITVRNPLTVVLFILLGLVGRKLAEGYVYTGNKKILYYLLVFGLTIPISLCHAYILYERASGGFKSRLFVFLTAAILFAGFYAIFAIIVKGIYFLAARQSFSVTKSPNTQKSINSEGDTELSAGKANTDSDYDNALFLTNKNLRLIFFLTAAICFICYLPYFLYEFPGIMTADSLVQYGEIIGTEPVSNHHPIIHTFIIYIFYTLGMLITGDPVKAMSFYTLAQMVFMSLCAGAAVCEAVRIKGFFDKKIIALLIAFFALMPFNAVYAVTVWKDVPFAGIAVLLSIHLIGMYRRREELKISDFIIYIVLWVLFSLFRSNAFYVFAASIVFCLFFYKSRIKEVLIASLSALAIILIIKGPVFSVLAIPGHDFTESLSVPLQQIARVIVDGGDIDSSDLEKIDSCVEREYVDILYIPEYADNIKELVRAGHPEIIENNKKAFFMLWLRMGLKNPGLYVRGWFDLVSAYIYPDVAYNVAEADGITPNALGLYSTPIIGGKFIKVKEILLKLSDFMPLYGMLFSVGAYFWGVLVCFFICLRKKKFTLIHIMMILMTATLLIAAPVIDFRYSYSMVLTMPLWALLSIGEKNGRLY